MTRPRPAAAVTITLEQGAGVVSYRARQGELWPIGEEGA